MINARGTIGTVRGRKNLPRGMINARGSINVRVFRIRMNVRVKVRTVGAQRKITVCRNSFTGVQPKITVSEIVLQKNKKKNKKNCLTGAPKPVSLGLAVSKSGTPARIVAS